MDILHAPTFDPPILLKEEHRNAFCYGENVTDKSLCGILTHMGLQTTLLKTQKELKQAAT